MGAIGDLFKKPKVSKPADMPSMADPAIRDAEERKKREIAGRGGRASTILTQRGEAGTSAYGNSLLGQAG